MSDEIYIVDYPFLVMLHARGHEVFAAESPDMMDVVSHAIKVREVVKPPVNIMMVAKGMGCKRVTVTDELVQQIVRKHVSVPFNPNDFDTF